MIELYLTKEGEKKQLPYRSNSSLITIGRNSSNDIVLDDGRVSSHHAAIIENERGDYFVRDLGSLYGLLLNGRQCYRAILTKNDVISVFGYQLKVGDISKQTGFVSSCDLLSTNDVEIPIADIEEPNFSRKHSAEAWGKTKLDSKTFSNADAVLSTILLELFRLKELKPLVAQLLNEICKQIFHAKSGYIALFNINNILSLNHKIGFRDSRIPPIPRNVYSTTIKEGRPHFVEISRELRVAGAPIKDVNGVIGLVYVYDIPENTYTEPNKQLLSSLVENQYFRKHISECYSKQCASAMSADIGRFKWKEKFVGYQKNDIMQPVFEKLELLSKSDVPVILLGEKGTGKTYLAQMLHRMSVRGKKGKFVAADLNAVPASLVESELFGTVKGSFSNAVDRPGYFEFANGGTIFLDEIGDISLEVQSKIRAVLDTKTVRRVGSLSEIHLSIRIIAATNKDLDLLMKEGNFREDLFDRLGGQFSTIKLPPLRARKEDIVLLVNFFIDDLAEDKKIEGISRNAIKPLMNYDWPGNIRTLRDVIGLAADIASSEDRNVISVSDLPAYLSMPKIPESHETDSEKFLSLNDVEKGHILRVMQEVDWNKTRACELLGISRPTLNEKLKKYGIDKKTE